MVIVHFLMRMAGDRIVPTRVLIFVVLRFLLPLVQQKEINSRQPQLSDADMHRGVRSAGRIPVNYCLISFSDPTFSPHFGYWPWQSARAVSDCAL